MAKDGKTEKATPRRKQKAKEEGNVARSKELNNFLTLVAMAIIFFSPVGVWLITRIRNIFILALDLTEQGMAIGQYVKILSFETGKIFMVVIAIILLFHMINYAIQVGWLFSVKAVKPNLQRINPKNYFTNVFSIKTIFELFKNVTLFLILGFVAYLVFKSEIIIISNSILTPWQASLSALWNVFESITRNVLIAMFIIGIIDLIYNRWDHGEKLKMSKHEVKDEQKDMNGNPEIKRRQRQAMMAMLRNDIINETPEATFIVVNPTHYSVAIRWDREKESAPRVLVKGVDQYALLIREIAKENNIPIVEEPPLARELYRRVESKKIIPEDMYMAVILIIKKLVSSKKINI